MFLKTDSNEAQIVSQVDGKWEWEQEIFNHYNCASLLLWN